VPFDRECSTKKALDLTGQAIRDGARLIVFPEAFISGYPKGSISEHASGMRSPEGRKWFRTYFESAITVPGPEPPISTPGQLLPITYKVTLVYCLLGYI
jgi:nitrilase